MARRHLIAGGRARCDCVGYVLGLIAQILSVSDLQCAWILLLYCAAARPNYLLRVVHPGLTARFAAHHDASLWALSQLVSAPPTHMFWDVVSLPFSRGGLGLRSAFLTTNAAYWSRCAPAFKNTTKIQREHPQREKKNENGCERGLKKKRNFGRSGGGRSGGGRSRGRAVPREAGPHNPNHATPVFGVCVFVCWCLLVCVRVCCCVGVCVWVGVCSCVLVCVSHTPTHTPTHTKKH